MQCLLLDNRLLRGVNIRLFFLAGKSVTINAFSRFSLGTPERRSGGVSAIISPSSLEEVSASSARLFLALIPFSREIVPNIHVLCSPPRAIAASDSEPLQQRSYVSGPRRLCSARCCSATCNSRSPQSVDSEPGERICPLHRRPVYSSALPAYCAALLFL